MTTPQIRVEPDAGIPTLVRRLADDSKRLVNDEIELAKLEAKEAAHSSVRGAMWLGIAFGVAAISLTAFTIFLATVLGRLFSGNIWAGAIAAGIIELGIAAFLILRGVNTLKRPPYTLPATRAEAAATARWIASQRAD